MSDGDPLLDDLAAAVLDGAAVDWVAAESSADPATRTFVRHLRLVSSIVQVHHHPPPTGNDPPVLVPDKITARSDRWGHLRLLEWIGSGAFGEVFRAWDSRLDREVALKLLPTTPSPDSEIESSIIREGRLLAKVRHPNVITIYGAEQIGDRVGIWMEFVRGQTLEQLLQQGTVFSAPEAVDIGVDLCRAVSAVHAAGVLHRDIKAHNVTRAEDGRVVLMDFGTGRELDDNSSSDLTGTPLYVAPEVFAGEPATIRSEIYSLGVLLYHLVTGSYPVPGRTIREVRQGHEHGERIAVRRARPDLRPALARAIERACAPEPERRYENVDALARDLVGLQRRPWRVGLQYGLAAAVAVLLVALLISEVRARWSGDSAATQAGLSQTSAVPRRSDGPAIAVLPLKNLSTETGGEEFADGFTEEIINGLATNEHLQVRSRTSSFAFKNNRRDLRDFASQLDVSLVLDGSVRRSGNRFQLDTRLLQTSTGVTLWNESFDTDIGNVFVVRNRIIQSVVGRLGVKAGPSRRAYDLNPEAYGRYLTARALVSRRSTVGAQNAIEYFQQVIALAPDFAPAYAGIADAYAYLSLFTYQGVPVAKAQGLMRTAALKALELDPDLAEAHAAMGVVYARDLDWASSQHHFEQAIALNPSLSQVYTSYSFFTLRPLRKFDEAERLLRLALQSDPLSLDVWREMAELFFTVGRYDEAIRLLERVRAVDPQFPNAGVIIARALVVAGRIDEGLAIYDAIDSAATPVPHYRAYAYVRAGRRSDAEKLAAENREYPYRATIIYAALGDLDRAFEALNQTAEREPQRVPLLLTWPEMASLRADPRLAAFRKRFGLPDPSADPHSD